MKNKLALFALLTFFHFPLVGAGKGLVPLRDHSKAMLLFQAERSFVNRAEEVALISSEDEGNFEARMFFDVARAKNDEIFSKEFEDEITLENVIACSMGSTNLQCCERRADGSFKSISAKLGTGKFLDDMDFQNDEHMSFGKKLSELSEDKVFLFYNSVGYKFSRPAKFEKGDTIDPSFFDQAESPLQAEQFAKFFNFFTAKRAVFFKDRRKDRQQNFVNAWAHGYASNKFGPEEGFVFDLGGGSGRLYHYAGEAGGYSFGEFPDKKASKWGVSANDRLMNSSSFFMDFIPLAQGFAVELNDFLREKLADHDGKRLVVVQTGELRDALALFVFEQEVKVDLARLSELNFFY